jgi:hypothetical protein
MNRLIPLILALVLVSSYASAQSDLSPAIAKRIADNTPKLPPQSVKPSKPRSDAQDRNLKGRVRIVIEEREYLAETESYPGKRLRSITDFNQRGDRTKAIYFGDNGNPYEVNVFGYVDGARVSDYETIYENSGIGTGGGPPRVAPKPAATPDPRYSYSYEYKYIDGRLAEMQMFLNNGEKGMRYVYSYAKDQMEELAYGYDGKLNQKYLTVFDPKGYEIEWHDIAVINLPRPDRKYVIRNEAFDKQGNWTKRTFLKMTAESGKSKYEPYKSEYRTIAYYTR